jgi:hypothetical protein
MLFDNNIQCIINITDENSTDTIIIICSKIYLRTHKKTPRIQRHPASAFTAAIKKSTRTGQAQTSKTSEANTTQDYSMYSLVGMLRPARKLAPLDLANMPSDARYTKKLPLHRPMLSSLRAPCTNEARVSPPGLAASSPSICRSFIAGWPRRPYFSMEKGTKP